jgi:hypothetical protein
MAAKAKSDKAEDLRAWPQEWLRVITMGEAEKLTSLSADTLKRRYADRIIQLSPRRLGMRFGHAIQLSRKIKSSVG